MNWKLERRLKSTHRVFSCAAFLSMLEPRFRLALSPQIIEISDLLEWVARSGIVSTDERF